MTDDARIARLTELARRIARLTELARRIWPGTHVIRGYRANAWMVDDDSGVPLLIDHPRALDALEAALLVLAGEMDAAGNRTVELPEQP